MLFLMMFGCLAVHAVSYAARGVTAVSNGVRVVSTVSGIKSVSPTSTVLLQNKRVVPNAFQLLFLLGVGFFLRALFCCHKYCSSCQRCYVSGAASALSMVPSVRLFSCREC
jgi:hypothetical protein